MLNQHAHLYRCLRLLGKPDHIKRAGEPCTARLATKNVTEMLDFRFTQASIVRRCWKQVNHHQRRLLIMTRLDRLSSQQRHGGFMERIRVGRRGVKKNRYLASKSYNATKLAHFNTSQDTRQ